MHLRDTRYTEKATRRHANETRDGARYVDVYRYVWRIQMQMQIHIQIQMQLQVQPEIQIHLQMQDTDTCLRNVSDAMQFYNNVFHVAVVVVVC